MASAKRKAEQITNLAKRSKASENDHTAKRRKSEDGTNTSLAKHKLETSVSKSVFKDEEKAFPRGGASGLTPLEHKQIQVKANQDVLFEQAGTKRADPVEFAEFGDEAQSKSSKKRLSKKRKIPTGTQDKDETIRVEGLSYKKLSPGTIILGQIADITHHHLVIALPNSLVGYVPLTAISDNVNEKLEKLLQDDERTAHAEDEEDEEDKHFEDVNLQDMFHTGQYLRTCIMSTNENTARARKRLELSINPKLVNKGLSRQKIPVNCMVQASVVSNEDHGLVMDLGLGDAKLKGFLPKSELCSKVDHSNLQEGAVIMCLVTGLNSDGGIVKLSADPNRAGNLTKGNTLTEAPTIDVFLPGTAVDVLIADTTPNTVTGKILGLVDATADSYHSGASEKGVDVSEKHKIGSKTKGRIIFTCPDSEPPRVGVSLLDHIVTLSTRMSGKPKDRKKPLDLLQMSAIIEEAKVLKVQPSHGVFFDLGIRDVCGFAHISRLTNDRLETLSKDSGPFKPGSKHRARILDYNALDGLFQLSLEQTVLDQAFLRIEDLKAGQVVNGTVHKLTADKTGAYAVLVNLSEGITGLVPELHFADVRLQHPERKFREGVSVTARVLYTEPARHQIILTLKKSLVNSEKQPWTDYLTISEGDTSPGIVVNVQKHGAKVRFCGNVKAWLPVAEMSEAFIDDATRHFVVGQVVNVRALSVNPEESSLLVSCKDPMAVDPNKESAFAALTPSRFIKGTVVEKSEEAVYLDIGHGIRGILRIGHLTDGSKKKDISTMKQIRVGASIDDLVVLAKHGSSKTATVSNKPSLRKDAQSAKLATSIEDLEAGQILHGFVRGILPDKIFIEFGNGLSGPVFRSQMTNEMLEVPNFGLRKDESITVRVTHIDLTKNFFWLSMRLEPGSDAVSPTLLNSTNSHVASTNDVKLGATFQARIRNVKSTQLNVAFGEGHQGRVSMAEIYKAWNDIPDKKRPLRHFRPEQTISIQVLGRHDARNHKFLPITKRVSNSTPIYELTMKQHEIKTQADILGFDQISQGNSFIAFVNNIADRHLWVNISANIRGRVDFLDLTNDIEQLSSIGEKFPVGSALQVRVKSVDTAASHLDLSAVTSDANNTLRSDDLKAGHILPVRVTKVHEHSVVVHIDGNTAAPIFLDQLADDYDKANPSEFNVGDILRVCILKVDRLNKKLELSARPSRVLSSSLPVRDPEIKRKQDLQVNQVVRGFIKHVGDKGIHVRLGTNVDAFVRISHLSDEYINDWQDAIHLNQLVTGKIISNKEHLRNPELSLKASVVKGDYAEPLDFSDLKVGQIITAKVRHVDTIGVFLLINNSNNLSGLCHISKLADTTVNPEKIRDMYKKDDLVKAKIIKIEPERRRISFTLRYSEVEGIAEDEEMDGVASSSDSEGDVELPGEGSELEDVEMRSVKSVESIEDEVTTSKAMMPDRSAAPATKSAVPGLRTSGFDWTGASLDLDETNHELASDEDEDVKLRKKKSKKATIKEDRTGDLDAYGPQSVADYERLLLGQPNSAEMWVRYMMFQRELNEMEKSQQIARRALATINPREEKEKLDVWTALLHLENDFVNDEALERTFKEACQSNDSREIHERMMKIYISSGKLNKADSLYESMMKNKSFTPDPHFWLSYATFLMDVLSPPFPDRARALLQRATQSVPTSQHRYLTQKFGALEFKSQNGNAERGRTIFEGLVTTWPNKGDLWDVYLNLEMARGNEESVRALFERMTKVGKRKRKDGVFGKWIEWETGVGNERGIERVRALWEIAKTKDEEVL